jgi:hypothetical protein
MVSMHSIWVPDLAKSPHGLSSDCWIFEIRIIQTHGVVYQWIIYIIHITYIITIYILYILYIIYILYYILYYIYIKYIFYICIITIQTMNHGLYISDLYMIVQNKRNDSLLTESSKRNPMKQAPSSRGWAMSLMSTDFCWVSKSNRGPTSLLSQVIFFSSQKNWHEFGGYIWIVQI